MSSYSSDEFAKEWRFLIDKDFTAPNGQAYDYADDGLLEWGDEDQKLVSEAPRWSLRPSAISHDGKYFALVDVNEINVYQMTDLKHLLTLQGHESQIDALAFRPGASHQLISGAGSKTDPRGHQSDCKILCWNLETYSPNILATPEATHRLTRNAANEIIADATSIDSDVRFTPHDQKMLGKALEDSVSKFMIAKGAASQPKVFGRLLASFSSSTFDPTGRLFFYMPGNAPKYNGDDDWELRLYDIVRNETSLVLSGNRDNICWGGFNEDGSLIGTASWDGSFRVWDAKDGKEKYRWETGTQNWTAGFSPNGNFFAGTSGDGKLHIYNLSDGSEHWIYDAGSGWCRTLAWHPNSNLIALGCEQLGKLYLISLEESAVKQQRVLSLANMKNPNGKRENRGSGFIGILRVKFVDQGRKLAFFTTGDGSAEIYDIEEHVKWRFARAGTMNPPDDDTPVTSRGGYGMLVHEDHVNRKILVATVDPDAIRFWERVSLTKVIKT